MKKKLIRGVAELKIDNDGTVTYEQKLSLYYFLMFGIWSLFFIKKNRTLFNKNDIISITYRASLMTGNLITIKTDNIMFLLEPTSKVHLNNIIEFLQNSGLSTDIA